MNPRQERLVGPKLRRSWQRVLFGFAVCAVGSLIIYWLLSQYDPLTLSQSGTGTGRRRAAIRLMLSLLSPAGWGWLLFLLGFTIGLVGEWHSYRFKDLPTEADQVD